MPIGAHKLAPPAIPLPARSEWQRKGLCPQPFPTTKAPGPRAAGIFVACVAGVADVA
jgi:hypothetical protein